MIFFLLESDSNATPKVSENCQLHCNYVSDPKTNENSISGGGGMRSVPVSYTHLDVYKRQQMVYGDAVLRLESSSLDYHGQSVDARSSTSIRFFPAPL